MRPKTAIFVVIAMFVLAGLVFVGLYFSGALTDSRQSGKISEPEKGYKLDRETVDFIRRTVEPQERQEEVIDKLETLGQLKQKSLEAAQAESGSDSALERSEDEKQQEIADKLGSLEELKKEASAIGGEESAGDGGEQAAAEASRAQEIADKIKRLEELKREAAQYSQEEN